MNLKTLFLPIAIVVAIIVSIWMIKPAWNDYQANRDELVKLEKEEAEAIKHKASLDKYVSNWEALDRGLVDYVYVAMPDTESSDNFISEVNRSASQTGVVLDEIRLRDKTVISDCERKKMTARQQNKDDSKQESSMHCPKEKKVVEVSMKVNGDYVKVKSFLDALDIENRITNAQGVDISKVTLVNVPQVPSEGEGEEGQPQPAASPSLVQSEISFQVYYKETDDKIKLSQLSNSDQVLKKLLSEKIDQEQVEKVQAAMKAEPVSPVISQGGGKVNIFQ